MVLGWWEREEDEATNRYSRRFPPAAAAIVDLNPTAHLHGRLPRHG
jgi:hypothetical protein